jgi:hypothetical protein
MWGLRDAAAHTHFADANLGTPIFVLMQLQKH